MLIYKINNCVAAGVCCKWYNSQVRAYDLVAVAGELHCDCDYYHAIGIRKVIKAYLDGLHKGLTYLMPWLRESMEAKCVTIGLWRITQDLSQDINQTDFTMDWKPLFKGEFNETRIRKSKPGKAEGNSPARRTKVPTVRKGTQIHLKQGPRCGKEGRRKSKQKLRAHVEDRIVRLSQEKAK
jgi:hypothetical protein